MSRKKKETAATVAVRPGFGEIPVSAAAARAINAMDAAVLADVGPYDIAYVIMGRGGIIAANNERDGVLRPLVKDDPPEGRVYLAGEVAGLPVGTVIDHPGFGTGTLVDPADVKSDAPGPVVKFAALTIRTDVDGPPWDVPIRIVSRPT